MRTKYFFLILLLPAPAFAGDRLHPERYYQEAWCKEAKGRMEYRLRDGSREGHKTLQEFRGTPYLIQSPYFFLSVIVNPRTSSKMRTCRCTRHPGLLQVAKFLKSAKISRLLPVIVIS
jgi:hypothetical protein